MQSAEWRKWGSIVWLTLSSILPMFYVSLLYTLPLVYLLPFYGLMLGVSILYIFPAFESNLTPSHSYRQLNLQNNKESRIKRICDDIASKANIGSYEIWVRKQKGHPLIHAKSKGWPLTRQIVITEEVITVFEKGFNKESLEAMLAHEMAHIQLYDMFSKNYARLMKVISFLNCVLLYWMLCLTILNPTLINWFLGWQALAYVLPGLLCVVNEFVYAALNRAIELIADEHAAKLTGKPQAVASLIKNLYFQYFYYGILVVENSQACGERCLPKEIKRQNMYKRLYREVRKLNNFNGIKTSWEESATNESPRTLLWKVTGYAQSWLGYHPSSGAREDAIRRQFSEAFLVKSPKPLA